MFYSNIKIKNTKGFTFVEIVVVLAIFAAITATLLFNFRDFTEGISLQNLTQNIALQVSTAQRQALAGSKFGHISGFPVLSEWKPSYGICFTKNATGCYLGGNHYYTGQNSQGVTAFQTFADNNGQTEEFQVDGVDNHLDTIKITGNDHIFDICINEESGTNTSCNIDQVSAVFTRPESAPKFFIPGNNTVVNDVTIKVSSPEGSIRNVVIWRTGQIEVR